MATRTLHIQNLTRSTQLCARCEVAGNMWARMKGLLGREGLAEGTGLLIPRCSSVHMWGMKFPLDVVYLTREHQVTDLVENLAIGKMHVARSHHGRPAMALELPAGTVRATGTERGDQLELRELA